jgi:hypothetical protein
VAIIESNKVGEMIAQNVEDAALKRTLLEKLNALVQSNEADDAEGDAEKAPPVKKQFSIVLSDQEGKMPAGLELVGWVVQIPEDASVTSTLDRIHKAAYEFNTTKKGRMMPAKTVADAIENVPAKHFKEQQIWVKTKVPVFVLRTDNDIPMEKSDRSVQTRDGRRITCDEMLGEIKAKFEGGAK